MNQERRFGRTATLIIGGLAISAGAFLSDRNQVHSTRLEPVGDNVLIENNESPILPTTFGSGYMGPVGENAKE